MDEPHGIEDAVRVFGDDDHRGADYPENRPDQGLIGLRGIYGTCSSFIFGYIPSDR
jgi:hypothetical protein